MKQADTSDKICRGTRNTYFMFNNFFLRKIVPFMRKCGKNAVQWGRPQIIRRLHIACWIPKATNTNTHTNTHKHPQAQTQTHTNTQTIQTHTHTHANTHTHSYKHTHTHIPHPHPHIQTHTHTHTYKHTNTNTHRLCNTHSFPTTTMVTGTRLNVTLYVHCLSCWTQQLHIHDMISQCCVIIYHVRSWRWQKKAETSRRFIVMPHIPCTVYTIIWLDQTNV
jgi:hypothetical protein